jgi:hypothetical protein
MTGDTDLLHRDLRWTLTRRRHGAREHTTIRGVRAWLLLAAALAPWVLGVSVLARAAGRRLARATGSPRRRHSR